MSESELTAIGGLEHFRVVRGGRDSGDILDASFIATSPDVIAPGMAGAGFTAGAQFGWSFGGPEQISGYVHRDTALVKMSLSGDGSTTGSWTIGSGDIRLAKRIESALEGADWIRFWF